MTHLPAGKALPLLVLAAGIGLVLATGLHRHLSLATLAENRQVLAELVKANPLIAPGGFVLAYAAAVALSVPGAIFLTLAGGLLFGVFPGTVYVVTGATLGATVLFLAARTALGDMLRSRVGPRIAKLEDGFRRDALSYLLFLRLVPAFPFWLVNLVPALLGVGLPTFVLGTFLGIIPGTFVYVSVGNGLGAVLDRGGTPDLGVVLTPSVLLPLVGLALLSLVPILVRMSRRPQEAPHG
jgi:uncharacterized membrane protein YdjX (TVP38/TMEM64 family)